MDRVLRSRGQPHRISRGDSLGCIFILRAFRFPESFKGSIISRETRPTYRPRNTYVGVVPGGETFLASLSSCVCGYPKPRLPSEEPAFSRRRVGGAAERVGSFCNNAHSHPSFPTQRRRAAASRKCGCRGRLGRGALGDSATKVGLCLFGLSPPPPPASPLQSSQQRKRPCEPQKARCLGGSGLLIQPTASHLLGHGRARESGLL